MAESKGHETAPRRPENPTRGATAGSPEVPGGGSPARAEADGSSVLRERRPRPRPFQPGLPTGTGLGKYRILERIGTSHDTIIYKARDAMLDRLVTVKQMVPELLDDPIACGHFKREAQFLARIPRGTPHLVGIHELIEDDVGLFIVEEYAGGHRLESLISKRRIDLDGAVRILKTAALGLRTLHALSIVHRGIHPGNIVVAPSGRARVTNLATAAHESDTTPPPVIVPKYAAPELLSGEHYDDRIDIYALGIVLFEMCVGRPALRRHFKDLLADPANADARWTEWHTNRRTVLPDAADLNPQVPRRLSDVIRRMTAKDLDERFASIQEVLVALTDRPFPALPPAGLSSAAGRFIPAGLPAVLLPDSGRPLSPPGHLLHSTSAEVVGPTGVPAGDQAGLREGGRPGGAFLMDRPAAFRPPPKPTSTYTVRPASRGLPSERAPECATPRDPAVPAAEAAVPTIRPFRRRRRRSLSSVPRRLLRIKAIPTPEPVVETLKERHPHRVAWFVAAVLLLAAAGPGMGWLWYHHFGPGLSHPIESVMSEAVADYDNGRLASAHAKFLEATRMEVRRRRFSHLRDEAERLVILVEAEQALVTDDFDGAEEKLREARRRGASPSRVDDLQWKIWNRRDVYRLAAEGFEELDRGNLAGVELSLDEFEHKAEAAGLDPLRLRDRLELSRKDRKYAEAIQRAKEALAEGDYEAALRNCRSAGRIKPVSEVRELRKQIQDRKARAEWILRGDEAMLDKEYEEAAAAYEEANLIEASKETEGRARVAGAYVLYEAALAEIAKGNLLAAERDLRSSRWKYRLEVVERKLSRMASAFDAARLARQADRAIDRQDYGAAQRLYKAALPNLPPPADVAVREKLAKAQRAAAGAGS